MLRWKRMSAIASVALAIGGCSHSGKINSIADDDNRAMADSRQEQLLLNILRASAREPLQFSALGEVATTVKDGLGLDTAAQALLAGGQNVITPTLKFAGETTPVVKVTPLSNKEFTDAILRPISPETLSLFIKQGWDAEFLLPLVVAGYRCSGGEKVKLNSGEEGDETDLRLRLLAAAPDFQIVQQTKGSDDISLLVSQPEALEMLRTGVSGGYSVKGVVAEGEEGKVRVTLKAPETKQWIAQLKLCPAPPAASAKPGTTPTANPAPTQPREPDSIEDYAKAIEAATTAEAVEALVALRAQQIADQIKALPLQDYSLTPQGLPATKAGGELVLRSVEGIIYYLGERLRSCYLTGAFSDKCAVRYTKLYNKFPRKYFLFRVQAGDADPLARFAATKFYGKPYWIQRLDPEQNDRTVKTVSFINQLIALQTDRASIPVTPTVLSIGQ